MDEDGGSLDHWLTRTTAGEKPSRTNGCGASSASVRRRQMMLPSRVGRNKSGSTRRATPPDRRRCGVAGQRPHAPARRVERSCHQPPAPPSRFLNAIVLGPATAMDTPRRPGARAPSARRCRLRSDRRCPSSHRRVERVAVGLEGHAPEIEIASANGRRHASPPTVRGRRRAPPIVSTIVVRVENAPSA